jgi:opacity protein-like surface antigen
MATALEVAASAAAAVAAATAAATAGAAAASTAETQPSVAAQAATGSEVTATTAVTTEPTGPTGTAAGALTPVTPAAPRRRAHCRTPTALARRAAKNRARQKLKRRNGAGRQLAKSAGDGNGLNLNDAKATTISMHTTQSPKNTDTYRRKEKGAKRGQRGHPLPKHTSRAEQTTKRERDRPSDRQNQPPRRFLI